MLGVSGGSYLFGTGIWLAIALGFAIWTCTLPTALLLPGGKYHRITQVEEVEEEEEEEEEEEDQYEEASCHLEDTAILMRTQKAPDPSSMPVSPASFTNSCSSIFHSISTPQTKLRILPESLSSLRPYAFPLCIFLTHETTMGIRDIAEQWMSTRYRTPLRHIGYILAGQTLFGAMILGLLPTVGSIISKATGIVGRDKDLFVVKASIGLSATGAVLVALAPSNPFLLCGLAVFASAVGFHDAMIAVVSRRQSDSNPGSGGSCNGTISIARLYISISIIEVVGNMANGPLWASVYGLALKTGTQVGIAMPFLVAGMSFAALVWGLK